jgi:hypothetical protein
MGETRNTCRILNGNDILITQKGDESMLLNLILKILFLPI